MTLAMSPAAANATLTRTYKYIQRTSIIQHAEFMSITLSRVLYSARTRAILFSDHLHPFNKSKNRFYPQLPYAFIRVL